MEVVQMQQQTINIILNYMQKLEDRTYQIAKSPIQDSFENSQKSSIKKGEVVDNSKRLSPRSEKAIKK